MARIVRKALEIDMEKVKEIVPPSEIEGYIIMGGHCNANELTLDLMQLEKKEEIEALQAEQPSAES